MHIATQYHLNLFYWFMPRILDIVGRFCSNKSNSNLQVIRLQGSVGWFAQYLIGSHRYMNNWGSTGSDQSNARLENIASETNTGMIETLPANMFDHCTSLKYLSIHYTGLAYLPDRLFATNVSKLETLILSGNRLNSKTPWSDVLMQLHELKYLDLSWNMLTSWTYNLSSLLNLEMLDLSHNTITKISYMAFTSMKMLKFLSLEVNNLAFLEPQIQPLFAHIPMLNLNSNNINKLNLLSGTLLSDAIVLDVSKNNLTEIDLVSIRKCSLPCSKISVFGDNNKLSQFVLPCSNTQQYDTVSLTNNTLTDINSIFPNVLVQQCSVETLNLSGNYFKSWNKEKVPYQYYINRNFWNENRSRNITSLDMTHCRIEYIDPMIFSIYTIQFLDLRENAVHIVPLLVPDIWSYPRVIDVQINPIICNCQMSWLKLYLLHKEAHKRENEILVTTCMEPLWNTSMDIVTVPNIMFMCDIECPQQIHEQCHKADRCYQAYSSTAIDAAICLTSHNDNDKLSSAFITVSYQLYISGFNLTTLELPYVRPHNLTHLNLT